MKRLVPRCTCDCVLDVIRLHHIPNMKTQIRASQLRWVPGPPDDDDDDDGQS